MNPIGITQGRLSPPTGGRIQSFPIRTWQDEFFLAQKAGLQCIEWVYQVESEGSNPLRTDNGVEEIRKTIGESGVTVSSVTADYYMTERLVAADGTPRESAIQHLKWLLARAALVSARYVMTAFVDGGKLGSDQEIAGLCSVLEMMKSDIDKTGVHIYMETDLSPAVWREILENASHPGIRVCYDTGDRASQGHTPAEDFKHLGKWLGSVHMKDRLLGGSSVPLGAGSADLSTCVRLFQEVGYTGPLILQTARGDNGDELGLTIRNRAFLENILRKMNT